MRRALLAAALLALAGGCTERPSCRSDCDCWGPPDGECGEGGEWRCVVDECFWECRASCVETGRCEEEGAHCSPDSGLCSLRTACTDGLGGTGG